MRRVGRRAERDPDGNEVPAGEQSALSAQAYSVNSKVPESMNSFMAHIKNENFSVILMIFLILALSLKKIVL